MSDEPQPMEIDPNNPAGAAQESQSLLQEVIVAQEDPNTKEVFPKAISDTAWETALSTWINDRVRNSPIAGATEAWNHLMGALPHLRTVLETELGKKE